MGRVTSIGGQKVDETKAYGKRGETVLETALREGGLEDLLGRSGFEKARKRIKPIPDPEAGKAARRKELSRKRKTRGGRASTILSEGSDVLG